MAKPRRLSRPIPFLALGISVITLAVLVYSIGQKTGLFGKALENDTSTDSQIIVIPSSGNLTPEERKDKVSAALDKAFKNNSPISYPKELETLGLISIPDVVVTFSELNRQPTSPQYGDPSNKLTFDVSSSPESGCDDLRDSTLVPWTPTEKAALKKHLISAESNMRKIMGPPALNQNIRVAKISTTNPDYLGLRAFFHGWTHSICILDKSQLIPPPLDLATYIEVSTHEMGHAFRDPIFAPFEEQLAEAISTEVDNDPTTLPQPNPEPNKHHILNMWHENQNKPSLYLATFQTKVPSLRIQRYLDGAFSLSKIYLEDKSFFRNLHQEYFRHPELYWSRNSFVKLMAQVKQKVEGKDLVKWVKTQFALSADTSDKNNQPALHSLFASISNFSGIMTTSFQVNGGSETPRVGDVINFSCDTLYSQKQVCQGQMTTDSNGFAYHIFPPTFSPAEPFKVTFNDLNSKVTDTSYGVVDTQTIQAGYFGISPDYLKKIRIMQQGQNVDVVDVNKGRFVSLKTQGLTGRSRILPLKDEPAPWKKTFYTKDSSPYFVNLIKQDYGPVPQNEGDALEDDAIKE